MERRHLHSASLRCLRNAPKDRRDARRSAENRPILEPTREFHRSLDPRGSVEVRAGSGRTGGGGAGTAGIRGSRPICVPRDTITGQFGRFNRGIRDPRNARGRFAARGLAGSDGTLFEGPVAAGRIGDSARLFAVFGGRRRPPDPRRNRGKRLGEFPPERRAFRNGATRVGGKSGRAAAVAAARFLRLVGALSAAKRPRGRREIGGNRAGGADNRGGSRGARGTFLERFVRRSRRNRGSRRRPLRPGRNGETWKRR